MRDGMAQHGMAGAPGSVARHGGCLDLRSSLKQVGRVSLRVVGPLPLREGRNQTAKWHCGRSARACAAAEGEGRLSWRVACSASAASSTSRVTLVKSSGRRVGCSAAPSAEPHRLRGRSRRGSRRCASPTQQPRCCPLRGRPRAVARPRAGGDTARDPSRGSHWGWSEWQRRRTTRSRKALTPGSPHVRRCWSGVTGAESWRGQPHMLTQPPRLRAQGNAGRRCCVRPSRVASRWSDGGH